jgi:D-tyrosyl-tRNA(Tyr) deacylase
MCPKYALPIDEVMVKEAVEKNVEKTTYALIDWKGVSSDHRRELVIMLKRHDLEITKV